MQTSEESKEESYDGPPYNKPGRILVEIYGPGSTGVYRYESYIHDYDSDSSVYWINEGVGFDWWLDGYCNFDGIGFFVVEGIKGEYIRGDGWHTDDDEVWEFSTIRPATIEEINTKTLCNEKGESWFSLN